MYIIPQPYMCPRCKHECEYTPHGMFPAPAFDDGPICPVCWAQFIRSVAPIMDRVIKQPLPNTVFHQPLGTGTPQPTFHSTINTTEGMKK